MMMFCRPPGYGETPEPADAYARARGEIIAGEPSTPTGRALASAMAQLWAGRYGGPERGPRPASSEGGEGRAVPGRGDGIGDLAADLQLWTAVADTGAEAAWAQRPQRNPLRPAGERI